jgi:hypothetical protein
MEEKQTNTIQDQNDATKMTSSGHVFPCYSNPLKLKRIILKPKTSGVSVLEHQGQTDLCALLNCLGVDLTRDGDK